jgi:hypothetical protein
MTVTSPTPPTDRHLLIGGVGLVRGSVQNAGVAMVAICDGLQPHLATSGWFPKAPFHCVSLIIRFAEATNLTAELGTISRRHRELAVSVDLNIREAQAVASSVPSLTALFRSATISALRAVAERYNLPSSFLTNSDATGIA